MPNSLPVAILKTPFTVVRKILSFLFSPQGRIILIVMIIAVIFFVVRGQFTQNDSSAPGTQIPAYQQTLPSKALAPKILQTTTRYYAYATFTQDNQYFTLTDYYDYNSNKWVHHTSPLPIDKKDIVSNITR